MILDTLGLHTCVWFPIQNENVMSSSLGIFSSIASCGYPFSQAGYDADPPMYLDPEFVQ